VGRYTFIVVDFHLLLLAGLPAHSHRDPQETSKFVSSAAQQSPRRGLRDHFLAAKDFQLLN